MTEVTKITDGAGVQHAVRDDNAVHRKGDETVDGAKTFSDSPLVPTLASTDDNSQKSASTGWVTSKITAWWNAIKSTVTFSKAQVGLGNVDNTSDANKPVSTATQTALDAKANDNAVVKLTGDQAVGGVKSFTAGARAVDLNLDPRAQSVASATFGRSLLVMGTHSGSSEHIGGIETAKSVNGLLSVIYGARRYFDDRTVYANITSEIDNSGRSTVRFQHDEAKGSCIAVAGMPKDPAVDTTITTSGIIEFGQGVISAPFSCWVLVGRKALADTSMAVIVTKGPNGDNYNNRIFQSQIPVRSGALCYITVPVPKGANVFAYGENLTTSGLAVSQRYCKCYAAD